MMVPHCYRMHCGIPALTAEVVQRLRQFGCEVCAEAPPRLLIDGSWGVALPGRTQMSHGEWVVVTDNPCPESWEDLWTY